MKILILPLMNPPIMPTNLLRNPLIPPLNLLINIINIITNISFLDQQKTRLNKFQVQIFINGLTQMLGVLLMGGLLLGDSDYWAVFFG